MKKVQKTLSALLLAAVTIISLNSCKKDANTVPALGSATVSGQLTAQLDVNTAALEPVAGATVLITVNTADQVTNTNGNINYPTQVFSGVSDANGMYSIVVSVGDNALPVTVAPQSFAYNQVQVAPAAPVRKVYTTAANSSNSVYKGSNLVLDFAY